VARRRAGAVFYPLGARSDRQWPVLPARGYKAFAPDLQAGDRLSYVLRANATKDQAAVSRIAKDARAEVRMRTAQEAGTGWMPRQGAAKGFIPVQTEVTDPAPRKVSWMWRPSARCDWPAAMRFGPRGC
jgi:CRISPR system Cascade subunit CasE